MAAPEPELNNSLTPETVISGVLGIKKAATVVASCNCKANWLESTVNIIPLSIDCNLNFVGAGGCEDYSCTKVDYSAAPELNVKRLTDFNLNSIACVNNATTTTNLELKRNIRYLTERCVLTVANTSLTINNNMQPTAISFNLNVASTNAYNNIISLPAVNSLKQKLIVRCCGVDSFILNSLNYRSTIPVFNSFSSRLT